MPILKSIRLFQFKNYQEKKFTFKSPIIGIIGPNGVGKTNLLDAIYYLGFTKSNFQSRDALNASFECQTFSIDGVFKTGEKVEKVRCVLKNKRKQILLDDVPYKRFSAHIGKFPMVFVAPDDYIIITGGSSQRRKFMDMLLVQTDHQYMEHLIGYQKILKQRNSLLQRDLSEGKKRDLLDVFDQQLGMYAPAIFQKRKEFTEAFEEIVTQNYLTIAGEKEHIHISYQSSLNELSFDALMHKNRRRDLLLQRTTSGVHRDDFKFIMKGHELKQVGSQGQKKSFLFALKLAQFDVLKKEKNTTPILLLDDLFEKLDHGRIKRLIKIICEPEFGQVFITDTEEERLVTAFDSKEKPLQLIRLED